MCQDESEAIQVQPALYWTHSETSGDSEVVGWVALAKLFVRPLPSLPRLLPEAHLASRPCSLPPSLLLPLMGLPLPFHPAESQGPVSSLQDAVKCGPSATHSPQAPLALEPRAEFTSVLELSDSQGPETPPMH